MKDFPVGSRSVAIDVSSASYAFDPTKGPPLPIGIFCNAASTITGALIGDSAEIAWILPAGYSPLAFRSINTSSTTKTGMRAIFEK